VTPFALDPEAARALARHIVQNHPEILFLCAISTVAEPACNELRLMGYELAGDPRCVFMQLNTPPPQQPFEELARLIKPGDYEEVARLHRYLHNVPQDSPVTEEELRSVSMNPLCYVLVSDGKVVSTATTNGIGISAFQIIGVVTLPELRKKGYASAICASLIRRMWADGALRSILFTEIDNSAAQACYYRLGFRADGEYWMAKIRKVEGC
jgi:RimJ/RimL family protein N-acetyltransferase